MKIVIAALSAPASLNGVSRHAANVVRGLLTRCEIREIHMLVGEWQQKAYEDAVARADARLHIHPVQIGRGTLSRNTWYYSELPRIASQLYADVVHLAYPVPLKPRAFHCAVAVSLHDLYAFDCPDNFGFIKGIFNRFVIRRCLRAADAIACVSESTKSRLKQRLGQGLADRAFTIPNGVESLSAVCGGPPYVLRGCNSFLLCVAQHRRNKNISLAIKVFESVLRSGALPPDARLVIIGVPGPETARIEEQIRVSHLERKVQLLSGIPDSEMQWCYRNCGLLLAPSTTEGFGLPVVEGLMAGCRIVCSDIAAFREVGGEFCRYVALGNGELEGFSRAVQDELKLPRVMPVSIPQLAIEQIAEKYLTLYRYLENRRAGTESEGVIGSKAGGPTNAKPSSLI